MTELCGFMPCMFLVPLLYGDLHSRRSNYSFFALCFDYIDVRFCEVYYVRFVLTQGRNK